ncbi:TfuA-like protein [Actinoallomurus sp. NPDC052308]|uniref:TfuA-like protein n=1 Tax=Actinoallomurus sp. NPDC052308 TaxID=3155530 RepID=UPI0034454BEC
MTVHVFCGPTIGAEQVGRILPEARTHPPVRHGDLLALGCAAGDVVVIIDGVFHSTPPVRHKEILLLLAEGVSVVGASSMGALRAAELYPFGMRGVGRIFEMYRDGRIEADDEVAVAHTPDDLRPLSVPLVDVRIRVGDAVNAAAIGRTEADRLLAVARELHYPARTPRALADAVADDASLRDAVDRMTHWQNDRPEAVNAKYADAVEALRLVADGRLTPPDPSEWAGTSWRTTQIEQWITRFHVRRPGAGRIPVVAELQHQQLYDPGFPARWRHAALTWITGGSLGDDPALIERRAIETARTGGLDRGSLDEEQAQYWLSPQEIHGLSEDEQLLRILVRSARFDAAGHARLTTLAKTAFLIRPDLDSAAAVAAAWSVNDAVAATAPHRAVHHLRQDLLRAHIADRWEVVATDGHALDAAARDRGFLDAAAAVEVARAFFLHASGVVPPNRDPSSALTD